MAIFEKLGFDNTNLCGFFHELGHYLDFNIFNTDDAAKLAMQKSLEKEVFNYINVLLNLKKTVQSIDDIKNLNGNFKTRVSHSLKAPFMNGVSDIFDGVTDQVIQGHAFHRPVYWKLGSWKLVKEATAHMTEAYFSGEKKIEIMKTFFPETYSQFEKTLEESLYGKSKN